MNITPLHDSIIFVFEDDTNNKGFSQTTESGIVYKSFDYDTKTPRWGTVLKVGPDVKFVNVGDRILIESLRWTEGHKIDDELTIWRTTEESVIGISTDD